MILSKKFKRNNRRRTKKHTKNFNEMRNTRNTYISNSFSEENKLINENKSLEAFLL